MNKIMSIGSGCPITQIIKDLGCRIPGPIDWVLEDQSINHLTLDLFSGNLFNKLLNKSWDTVTNFDIGVDGKSGFEIQADLCGGSYIHEDIVNDFSQYKKVLYRCLVFEKELNNKHSKVKFIRHLWDKDWESKTGISFFLDYLIHKGYCLDRFIFITDSPYRFANNKAISDIEDKYNIKVYKTQKKYDITHYIESTVMEKNRILDHITKGIFTS